MPHATTLYQYVVRSIDTLRPFGKNARHHSDKQIAKLVRSIKEFGFTVPIIIDDKDQVMCGFGRLMAARDVPMTEVPCIVVTGLSTAQKRALAISDNRLSLESTWSQETLMETLGEITADGLDVTLSGFDAFEIEGMLSPMPALDDDEPKDDDGEPKVPSIIVTVRSSMDIPSVAAILRKAVKTAGFRGVRIKEPA
jgi:ParB-like chromosome segregation protein Spo0J